MKLLSKPGYSITGVQCTKKLKKILNTERFLPPPSSCLELHVTEWWGLPGCLLEESCCQGRSSLRYQRAEFVGHRCDQHLKTLQMERGEQDETQEKQSLWTIFTLVPYNIMERARNIVAHDRIQTVTWWLLWLKKILCSQNFAVHQLYKNRNVSQII